MKKKLIFILILLMSFFYCKEFINTDLSMQGEWEFFFNTYDISSYKKNNLSNNMQNNSDYNFSWQNYVIKGKEKSGEIYLKNTEKIIGSYFIIGSELNMEIYVPYEKNLFFEGKLEGNVDIDFDEVSGIFEGVVEYGGEIINIKGSFSGQKIG